MKLAYRTRGNASPQGKPRVYLTGHPADLPACAEEIITDIFQTQNCAIYYDEEPDSPYDREELLRELEQMQLMVIPVTGRFLSQPNRARDVEFTLVVERHIPVLPLMQERGLERAFNAQCGDLQMLDKHDPDPTALPFAEKLEKFLASVLVGDELAEKVRAAFDAYVFLSYRKKDRKHAQELMRLIHKNEFCRDIAIWYDEFLTPGENFNEAIADAMGKCRLFTLAVTPNVVEPDNYVMRLEYPEAKKAGKPILPVELVPTERETLRDAFPDIPPVADARDEPAFSAALLEAVRKLAIRENDGSPEHNFFIGLAYLNGIDVEVDRTRALALITGAAEGGLPEAMEQLVSMYRSGGGVARDHRTAIRWQERLAARRQALFEELESEESGLELTDSLCDLGDYWMELLERSAAERAYRQMWEVCRRLAEQFGDVRSRREFAISCNRLGEVRRTEGNFPEARACFREALEVSEQLFRETGTEEARKELAIMYNNMGTTCWKEDPETAKADCLRALELYREPDGEAEDIGVRRARSRLYDNLGNICRSMGNLDEARGYCLQAVELDRQMYEETGSAQAREDLALSCNTLGDVSREAGRLDEARMCFRESYTLRKAQCEETGTVEAKQDLVSSCIRLCALISGENGLDEAKDYCLEALELCRQSREESASEQVRQNLANTCGLLQTISGIYRQRGEQSQREGDLARAEGAYRQALELNGLLLEETGAEQAEQDAALCRQKLEEVRLAGARQAEAKAAALEELELRKRQCGETGSAEARRNLCVAYDALGDLCLRERDLAGARDYYRQGLALSEQLSSETGTVEARRDLAVSYSKFGELGIKEGDPRQAVEYWNRSLQIYAALCGETKSLNDYNRVAALSFNMGMTVDWNLDLRKKLLVQAYNVWGGLSKACPDAPEYARYQDMVLQQLVRLEHGN